MFRRITLSNIKLSSKRLLSNAPDALVHKGLWQTTGFVNGKFLLNNDDKNTFDVYNPCNGKLIAKCPRMNVKDVNNYAQVSMDAFNNFKTTTAFERSKMLLKMADLMGKYSDDLALILSLESGKPFAEAKGEIAYARSFYELYAEEAKRISGEILQPTNNDRRILTIKQPVGPAALITPWNFPSAMITRKVGPAIAAGCSVVIKPSEDTPLSALALCVIAKEAGIPDGVINCLTVGREEVVEVGTALCHSSLFRKLSFTGSTPVGKWLMRESAHNVKKLSLELGGNAPFIVFDDADLEVAVAALMNCKFRNAGQTCISSNRILVQEGVYDKFAKMVTEKVNALSCGDSLTKGTTMGPLINKNGLAKVSRQVQDSLKKGAVATTGGKPHEEFNSQGGTFFHPTVMTGVTSDMAPFNEETFGPVAFLSKFKTEAEAITIANSTPFGLAGYACTRDLARAFRVSEALDFGMVGINEGAISAAHTPFGGVKESGLGREGGHWGIEEYLETKYICMGLGK